jgi:hypothetical protein
MHELCIFLNVSHIDCVFFHKLNVDCVFYPVVTGEMTKDRRSRPKEVNRS